MADAADSTPAPGGQFALTVADLNTAVNHEPRVEDIRLAEALGMRPAREIRRLIDRHREALERFGEVCGTVPQTSAKGGRPGRTFWLNKRQALYLCTKSETPRATETTIQMVEVLDAHLAARVAPRPEAPRAEPGPPAPVAFLPGPEPLVSSLALAQALGRRHTGILRELDVLAAERPELVGRHIRFSTYLHENRRPYRCFHLDRLGFEALMRRLPSADGRAVALRDATLAAFGPPALAALSVPVPAAPALDRDGIAVMRIAGETVTVDMLRFEPAEGERAVLITHGGDLLLDRAVCLYPDRNWQGRRVGHALTPLPGGGGPSYAAGWVIGTVVEPRPARATSGSALPAPRGGRARTPKLGAPRRRDLPALLAVAVAGHA